MSERPRPLGRSSDALVAERRERMLQAVLAAREMTIADLAGGFDVSVMTVHRDLDFLAEAGLLRKSRGRAVAPSGQEVATSARFRLRSAQAAKEAVARTAAGLLEPGQTMFVDDSTSVLPVLQDLPDPASFTVITNYVRAAQTLAHTGAVVHLLGGELVPELEATFGPVTVEAVDTWRVDVVLMGNPAVTRGRLYHPRPESVALKRAMLAAAERSVLLIDHSKLGRRALANWASVAEFSDVVVDSAADPEELAVLRQAGPDVLVVDVPAHETPEG